VCVDILILGCQKCRSTPRGNLMHTPNCAVLSLTYFTITCCLAGTRLLCSPVPSKCSAVLHCCVCLCKYHVMATTFPSFCRRKDAEKIVMRVLALREVQQKVRLGYPDCAGLYRSIVLYWQCSALVCEVDCGAAYYLIIRPGVRAMSPPRGLTIVHNMSCCAVGS
jgi:hypothetical protein